MISTLLLKFYAIMTVIACVIMVFDTDKMWSDDQ